jgi:hypothetical protein
VKAGSKQSSFFGHEDGDDVPPKRRLTFNGLSGVISQKIELFITTAVRNSDPTRKKNCNVIFDMKMIVAR